MLKLVVPPKTKSLSYQEYDKIASVPFNRDVEERIKKTKKTKKFDILRSEHCCVAIAELTKDSEYHGKMYKAGIKYVVDSNTRKYFWAKGLTDTIPTVLSATWHDCESMDEMFILYNTFDSMTSAESTAEKMTGVACMLNLKFNSSKFQKGQYVTALNYASHGLYPHQFDSAGSSSKDSFLKMQLFKNELQLLDSFRLSSSSNQSILAAYLMALKCHELSGTDDKVKSFIVKTDNMYCIVENKNLCGVTFVTEELKRAKAGGRGAMFSWGTKHAAMKPQISFILWAIDNWVADNKVQRYTVKDYFSEYRNKHSLNFMLNLNLNHAA
tara:strand:+ start:53 stop:1030 length:978 start_codon:yes stop_codon:yes gene_type:complete